MKIVVCNESALHFWSLPEERRARAVLSTSHDLADAGSSAKIIASVDPELMGLGDYPLHVLVSSDNARGKSKNCLSHIYSRPLPAGSLYRLANDVYITSPELTYFQMGGSVPIIELVMFGMQICGTYALDPLAPAGYRDHIEPLTSTDRLRRFESQLQRLNPRSPSVNALRWVTDGSASPMETAVFLSLCLPPLYGGYGFPVPQLNQKIALGNEAAKMALQRSITPDMTWPDRMVCVEYDSDLHATSSGIARDARRRSTLGYLGYQVLTVTKEQVRNPWQFHDVALQLSALLGKRLYNRKPGWEEKRRLLRSQLFPWKSWDQGL